MRSWAERMIVNEMQEESIVKDEKNALQEKIEKDKKHEASILALRLFSSYRHIESERIWTIVAYTYFVCKTLGLFILIDLLFFGNLNAMWFLLIFVGCYILNRKVYKYISKKKIKVNLPVQLQ